ncbi:MAG: CHAT domain-containing protein, partial [Chloroflexaceae bacterium]|nr:CHAT domain-containing protein [Chloroflexaceae bacterium]
MTFPTSGQFDEMLVRVSDLNQAQGLFSVTVTLEGDRLFRGQLALSDDMQPASIASIGDVAAFGLTLFGRLFANGLSAAFQQGLAAARANNRRLRFKLWLDSASQRLHRVPWELLYFDNSGGQSPPRPLATDDAIAFSRYLESSQPEGTAVARRPIHMLVAMAEPNDLDSWDLAASDKPTEQRELANRFSSMESMGQLAADFLEPRTSRERLHEALEWGGLTPPAAPEPDRGYDVLLYYGHALHHPQLGTRLLLEDNSSGGGALYNGEELVGRLTQLTYRPSLVVLIGCNTAATGEGPGLGNLAVQLVQQAGIPAVLAMQRLVEIPLARTFTFHLSDYLLRDGVVDVAVSAARRQVFESNSLSWSTPVLYMRNRDGRLFTPNARLEYIQQVLSDGEFLRWSGREFIDVEVISIPPGIHWSVLRQNPDDAPPPTDVLNGLTRAMALDTAETSQNLVALIGSPHSGQTTALQRLTWRLADSARVDFSQPVGVFVPLANYDQQRPGGNRLERLILETVAARVPTLASELQALFRQAGNVPTTPLYVLLLDGLDDVQERFRADITADLLELAGRIPQQRIVVSCTRDFLPDSLAQQARVLMLQPLNERQVLRYLRGRDANCSTALFRQMVENRLLDLATDPALLAHIYRRLSQSQGRSFSRNQLLQHVLDDNLEGLEVRFTQGDAARQTLLALAWELAWNHRDSLSLSDVFRVMAEVRGSRDYSLEELYQRLRDNRLLADVGQHTVRFTQPMLQTYCTAMALASRSDMMERLTDIVAMCGLSYRLNRWEDTVYTLAGMLQTPGALLLLGRAAIPENSSAHSLLLARSLESLSPQAMRRLPLRERQELLDACLLRLDSEREPSALRRAQIVTALGRLPYAASVAALRRLLTDKVRRTRGGPRYDYTTVRIAAARGLRNLMARSRLEQITPVAPPAPYARAEDSRDGDHVAWDSFDPALLALLQAWESCNEAGREQLRDSVASTSNSAPERALAAFALGDLADHSDDAVLLLDIVMQRRPKAISESDWDDTVWAATDALTLFDAQQVGELLAALLQSRKRLFQRSIEQLVYLAGRIRAGQPHVVVWLFSILLSQPDRSLKGKALQSLAWLGRNLDSTSHPDTGQPLGPLVRQAARSFARGESDLVLPPQLESRFAIDRLDPNHPQSLYLRRKALESLAWIGQQQELDDLYDEMV